MNYQGRIPGLFPGPAKWKTDFSKGRRLGQMPSHSPSQFCGFMIVKLLWHWDSLGFSCHLYHSSLIPASGGWSVSLLWPRKHTTHTEICTPQNGGQIIPNSSIPTDSKVYEPGRGKKFALPSLWNRFISEHGGLTDWTLRLLPHWLPWQGEVLS